MKSGIKRLVIVAYRLPFKFTKTKTGYRAIQNAGGLVSAILALSENFKKTEPQNRNEKILWIGAMDTIPEDLDISKVENDHFDLLPVLIPEKLNDLYYGGFCNDLVWPLFHYFPTFSVFNQNYYEAYRAANLLFCQEIEKVLKPGDFLWIHDYQLMFLPKMVRFSFPNALISFFLHIPFPSFEVFRLLPRLWREEIITGILGADLAGFHTHDYTQYFLKCVRRVTGYEHKQNIVFTPQRQVKADAFPIGIDYVKFNEACISKPVIVEKKKLKELLGNNKLIFSVDRLDYSKGLLVRLKGYELFLEMHPEWISKVVFNMVVVPSRDSIEKYRDMKKEIESMVGRINGKYSTLGWRPIIYQYKSLSFNELVALYDLSDVGLITPLRDGMNLVAKEYIASQVENKGVLILSEMAGAAAELTEALLINPVDSREMADSIKNALEMDIADKTFRIKMMQRRISEYNVFTWAMDIFQQSHEIEEQQKLMSVRIINREISNQIKEQYKSSKKKIIFLDYDGTLVSFAKYPELAVIEKNTYQIVKKLCNDKQNKVVIISGRNKEFLEQQFHDLDITLVAEHGFFIRRPGLEWNSLTMPDLNWKARVMPILKDYVNRCYGSFIEEKAGSLAWHYRNVDADYAQLRLNELKDDLSEIIRNHTNFEILEGNKVLEVKSGAYDKGKAAIQVIDNQDYDFILAAGDDKTDEDLFGSLPKLAYTIRVGLSPSRAKFNVADYSGFLSLLDYLGAD